MFSITKSQAAVKAFIVRYMAENGGMAPSYDEMVAGLGMSRGAVHGRMSALEKRGHIRRIKGHARAIEIVRDGGN